MLPSVRPLSRRPLSDRRDLYGDLPEERRIRLRIGVNLGDIIVEGSDKGTKSTELRHLQCPFGVRLGLGGPHAAASAARGLADLQAGKAEIADPRLEAEGRADIPGGARNRRE